MFQLSNIGVAIVLAHALYSMLQKSILRKFDFFGFLQIYLSSLLMSISPQYPWPGQMDVRPKALHGKTSNLIYSLNPDWVCKDGCLKSKVVKRADLQQLIGCSVL